ncbi:MAG: hypothetical protein OEX82_07995 [Nitrosomonas sp.]|nr:hypothetical protein [Nitrosomonas sp.]
MRISRLITITLITLMLVVSFSAQAMHHEPPETSAAPGKMPNNEGIVIEILETTGYTYMELNNTGRKFWIAAPTTKVKKGDHVRFVESMAMENFASKTLNRTFPRVIFVSSTQVKQ